MRVTDMVGRWGEELAARHLEAAGLQVLERNWRSRYGEIDIVALEPAARGSWLVFCEVKTRRSMRAGGPLEAVTPVKLARLRRLSGLWLAAHGRDTPIASSRIRIDVVGVLEPRTGPPVIEHLRGVG